jgi:hypothetical protein
MLLGYLIGVYAALGELLLIFVHFFGRGKIPALAHGIMIGFVCMMSVVAWHRKEDFQRLRWTRGRIELTRVQIVAVCLFVAGLVGVFVAIIGLTIGI